MNSPSLDDQPDPVLFLKFGRVGNQSVTGPQVLESQGDSIPAYRPLGSPTPSSHPATGACHGAS